MPSLRFPLTDPTGSRREAFLRLIRDADITHELDGVTDDNLVAVGAGLAVAAFEGRWAVTRNAAVEHFAIPGDVIELVAAAALAALTPTMGAFVLARPNEATLDELRTWLAAQGYKATLTYPARKAGAL